MSKLKENGIPVNYFSDSIESNFSSEIKYEQAYTGIPTAVIGIHSISNRDNCNLIDPNDLLQIEQTLKLSSEI